MRPPTRVLFVMGALDGEASGPDQVVGALANVLGGMGLRVRIYAGGGKRQCFAPGLLHAPPQCHTYPGLWLGGLSPSRRLRAALGDAVRDCDVVHNHSLWMLPNHYSSAIAHACRKPMVITPHGMLEPAALRISRWKKRIAGAWFQDRDLRRAACLHVLAAGEARSVRAYGLTNPTALIPNGVDIPPLGPALRAAFFHRYPRLSGKRLCLFLSRLHSKKGLPNLLLAWQRIVAGHTDWHLVIAGPDYGMEAQLRRMLTDLELESSVTLTGAVLAERKLEALSAASLFVLPSFTEGFSIAVLEAMAARLPVLITPGCNFPEVEEHQAGMSVEATAPGVEGGLRALLAASDGARAEMGARGRALVESHYTWERSAQKLAELYAWLCGGGPPPPFVEIA